MTHDLTAQCCFVPLIRVVPVVPTHTGRLQDFLTGMHDNIVSSFLPRKQDVTEDYWEWLKWRLGQVCWGKAGLMDGC